MINLRLSRTKRSSQSSVKVNHVDDATQPLILIIRNKRAQTKLIKETCPNQTNEIHTKCQTGQRSAGQVWQFEIWQLAGSSYLPRNVVIGSIWLAFAPVQVFRSRIWPTHVWNTRSLPFQSFWIAHVLRMSTKCTCTSLASKPPQGFVQESQAKKAGLCHERS